MERTGPTFVHCALDCCHTKGNTALAVNFHLISSFNRTFGLCSSCSGVARHSYCRCTDCSPLDTLSCFISVSLCQDVMWHWNWLYCHWHGNWRNLLPFKSKSWISMWKPTSCGAQLALHNHQPQGFIQPRGFLWLVTCTVQLWQCLEIHGAANRFYLLKYLYMYFTIHKNSIKTEQIHIRFRKQTLPYSVSIVLLLHIKKRVIPLLAKF